MIQQYQNIPLFEKLTQNEFAIAIWKDETFNILTIFRDQKRYFKATIQILSDGEIDIGAPIKIDKVTSDEINQIGETPGINIGYDSWNLPIITVRTEIMDIYALAIFMWYGSIAKLKSYFTFYIMDVSNKTVRVSTYRNYIRAIITEKDTTSSPSLVQASIDGFKTVLKLYSDLDNYNCHNITTSIAFFIADIIYNFDLSFKALNGEETTE